MSMSATAYTGWGLVFDEEDEAVPAEILEQYEAEGDFGALFEHIEDWLPFSVPYPERNEGESDENYEPRRKEWWALKQRAVPLSWDFFGTCDYPGGYVLTFSRTVRSVCWGCEEIEPVPMPNFDENVKMQKVLDAIHYTGDRKPRLLLWVNYG